MSASRVGREREWRVRDEMIAVGWHPVMRAAASKGPADLLMVHPLRGGALIQVGGRTKTISPVDRHLFVLACEWAGLLCILAVVPKFKREDIMYWEIEDSSPANWSSWTP